MKKEVKNATMMPRLTKFMFVVGFLLTTIMSYANNLAYAQNQTFTFHLKNVSIKTVLQTIEKQSEFIFMYRSDLLDTSKKVSVDADKKSVSQILDQILEGTAVTYEINDRQIVLKKNEIINKQSSGPQQSKRIYGVVKDEAGETVIGANVWVKGTTTGVVTDIDGRYQITLNDPKAILVFSYLGMKTQEVVVGNKLEINIVLVPDAERLDEVVVVGYGTQKKVNLTGSVASVDINKVTESRPITNISHALTGLIAGVNVQNANNKPGADDSSIMVRGQGTLNNSSPLIIIDGVEANINSVNPTDIESMTVLKDAASSSIYGSRAANGVILITTKQGKKGRIQLDYNGYASFESVSIPDKMTPVSDYAEYMELMNEANRNSGLAPRFSQNIIDEWKSDNGNNPLKYPNTNWIEETFRNVITQNHTLSVSGGSEKIKFYSSFGYQNNPSVMENTGFTKYSGRFNVSADIKPWLNVSVQLNGYVSDMEPGDVQQVFNYAYNTSPGMVFRSPDGRYGGANNPEDDVALAANNPLVRLNRISGNIRRNNVRSRFVGTLNPFKGFSITGSYSYDFSDRKDKLKPVIIDCWNFRDEVVTYTTANDKTYVENYNISSERYFNDIVGKYENRFSKDRLGFTIMFGASQEKYVENNFKAKKYDLIDMGLGVIDGATGESETSGNLSEWVMRSYFSRINLDWQNKYLLELNLRVDNSSRFLPDNRTGYFPSASFAWRLDQENFMKGLVDKGLSNLKLRLSYGSLGNNSVGIYDALSTYKSDMYTLNNSLVLGMIPSGLANANLSWESTYISNIGLDFGFLNNRLSGTLEFFNKKTKDILINLPAPDVHGLTSIPKQNSATVVNKGFELTLGWNDKVGELSYGINGNLTFVKNKIEKYKGLDKGGIDYNGATILWEGHPINCLYLLRCDRIIQTDEDLALVQSIIDNAPLVNGKKVDPFAAFGTPQKGDLLYKDLNGDGIINLEDREVVSDGANPKFQFGLNLNASYKGFDLSVLLQGQAGAQAYWENSLSNSSSAGLGRQLNKNVVEGRWYEGRTDAVYPRLLSSDIKINTQMSDFYLVDLS